MKKLSILITLLTTLTCFGQSNDFVILAWDHSLSTNVLYYNVYWKANKEEPRYACGALSFRYTIPPLVP